MARKKGPQVEQAYQYIQKKILGYEILPGAPVSDHALAEELGMSRAPVREAVMRLEAAGLVERGPNGAVCAALGKEDIKEICCLRLALETLAIELIFEKGGLLPEQKEELERVYHSFSEASLQKETVYQKGYYWDDVFHSVIVSFSGNKRLVHMLELMQLQITRARWLNVLSPRHNVAYEEHKQIYTALMTDDREGSIEAMRLHLKHTEENFIRILESPQYKLVKIGTAMLDVDD